MGNLGQTGADTLTHIVSIVALLALGASVPAVLGFYQHQAWDDVELVAIAGFESCVAVGMAYYSMKFQMTPAGVNISSDDTNAQKKGP